MSCCNCKKTKKSNKKVQNEIDYRLERYDSNGELVYPEEDDLDYNEDEKTEECDNKAEWEFEDYELEQMNKKKVGKEKPFDWNRLNDKEYLENRLCKNNNKKEKNIRGFIVKDCAGCPFILKMNLNEEEESNFYCLRMKTFLSNDEIEGIFSPPSDCPLREEKIIVKLKKGV